MSPMHPTTSRSTFLSSMTPTQSSVSYHRLNGQDFCLGLSSFTGQPTPFHSFPLPGPSVPGSPLASFPLNPAASGQLLGPLDPNDFSFLEMPSSTESSHDGSISPERHDALCRDYTCCGLTLPDLHSLVEHFEKSHAAALDPYAPRPLLPTSHHPEDNKTSFVAFHGGPERRSGLEQGHPCLFDTDNIRSGVFPTSHGAPWSRAPVNSGRPIPTPLLGSPTSAPFLATYSVAPSSPISPPVLSIPEFDMSDDLSLPANPHPYLHHPQPQIAYKNFDLDTMELYVDPPMSQAPLSSAPSPSGLSISPPLSGSLSSTPCLVTYSAAPSPPPSLPISPVSASDTTEVLLPRSKPDDDYHACLPRPLPSAGCAESSGPNQDVALPPINGLNSVVDGTLPLGGSSGNTNDSSLPSSLAASLLLPKPGCKENPQLPPLRLPPLRLPPLRSRLGAQSYPSSTYAATSRSKTEQAPVASILTLKPFKCPNAGCNKSYKQQNGLKYHTARGSCSSAPPEDLEKFKEALDRKRIMKAAAMGTRGDVMLSEADLREVQKEVQERLQPFACGIGNCQRRYKNLNGLRYHYGHSGLDHGTIGLALLASGQHESLRQLPSQSHS